MRNVRFGAAMLALVMTLTTALTPGPARAASGAEIEREARKGLQDLYAKNPKARELGGKALFFPRAEIFLLECLNGRHQRFRNEPAAERAKVSARVGIPPPEPLFRFSRESGRH